MIWHMCFFSCVVEVWELELEGGEGRFVVDGVIGWGWMETYADVDEYDGSLDGRVRSIHLQDGMDFLSRVFVVCRSFSTHAFIVVFLAALLPIKGVALVIV